MKRLPIPLTFCRSQSVAASERLPGGPELRLHVVGALDDVVGPPHGAPQALVVRLEAELLGPN